MKKNRRKQFEQEANELMETRYLVSLSVTIGLNGLPHTHQKTDIFEIALSRLRAGDASDIDKVTIIEVEYEG